MATLRSAIVKKHDAFFQINSKWTGTFFSLADHSKGFQRMSHMNTSTPYRKAFCLTENWTGGPSCCELTASTHRCIMSPFVLTRQKNSSHSFAELRLRSSHAALHPPTACSQHHRLSSNSYSFVESFPSTGRLHDSSLSCCQRQSKQGRVMPDGIVELGSSTGRNSSAHDSTLYSKRCVVPL